ncbi:MAG: M20 family metallopeptidase [Methyloligellaceae bacterium]
MTELDEKDLLRGIRSWVEIESQTADTEGVNAMLSLVDGLYGDLGAKVVRIPGESGIGDMLSISPAGAGDEPGILVLSHLDTVHARGTLQNLPWSIDGDRAYGPGTFDMKGGAYIAFAAFTELANANISTPLPVRFLYTSDEEFGSRISRPHIVEHAKNAKYVLVTEPSRDGNFVVGRAGSSRYRITVTGKAAHSGGNHHQGRNAILEMAHHIIEFESLTDYDRGLKFNVGEIKGGETANMIPEKCSIHLDIRHGTKADADEFDQRVRNLQTRDPENSISVTGQINRIGYANPEIQKDLFAHVQELARELGMTGGGSVSGGGSDANFTANDVPTLDGLGVLGDGAHTLHEHLLISSLVPRKTLFRNLFETLN